ITIDGIQFNVEDDQLAQAIQKQQSANDAEKEEMKKKLDQAEEEKEEMEKKKDKAEASKDALEKSTLDSDQLNKHISDRAILIVDARAILGDKMPECVDCPKEIMSAVVDHVLGLDDLSAKSDDYISAAYDMAVKKVKDAKGSLDSLSNDFANKEIVTDVAEARNNARIKYAKDHLGLEVK
ncbi:MAG: hypothetical protein GY746_13715, partial [Gammaproteobacteria bacterium]|nr:hypothetical protein [Gammaproteobacteria bacterium]